MTATIQKKSFNSDIEELENTMLCARWLVHQFEDLHFESIARLFQRAIDDAEAWIETMVRNGEMPEKATEPIKAEEAKAIHNILIKYASIDDAGIRQDILREMQRMTKKSYN